MSTKVTFGFPPADFDVDQCVLAILGKLAIGQAVVFDYLLDATSSMVNGDLTYAHLTHRVIHLRGQRKVFVFHDKLNGKKLSLYRLRTPTDDERLTWPTPTS